MVGHAVATTSRHSRKSRSGEFLDYSCINSLRMLLHPGLAREIAEIAVVVIGVHTPEVRL